MHVLTIGTDTNIFDPSSAVAARVVAQAASWDFSTIIVCSPKGFVPVDLAPNVRAIPTNSSSKLGYGFDALYLGMQEGRKATVISTQDPFEVGLVGVLLSWSLRRPVQVQVHTDFLSPEFFKHSFVNQMRTRIARFVLPRATRVRVVSLRIKQSLEAHYKNLPPVDVLPVFVDIEHIKNTHPTDALRERFSKYTKKVLVVARLEKEKNVQLALDAFAESASEDTCLIVVGEGKEREVLQKSAQERGIIERVFFEGWQDPAPYYHLADLLLVPSVYEGYGLVIAEAHAVNVPVLSTDVGIARESGAMISSPEKFTGALTDWFAGNLQEGEVRQYPYPTKTEYMQAYTKHLEDCLGK
ncbi:MAG: cap, capsular polysaccharide biosynthsis protein [Candidatus Adlerbacteria bacterium]|nr:cap, capsular polysaccharide biosynthsis protein [Candidatus Adlerbacteria bacterium]